MDITRHINLYKKYYIIFFLTLFFTQILSIPALSKDKPISCKTSIEKRRASKASLRQKRAVIRARREGRFARDLLKKRAREVATLEKKKLKLAKKDKRIRIKERQRIERKKMQDIYKDGKLYFDSGLYKEAIATWYKILLLEPSIKGKGDDKKIELLIGKAQRKIGELSKERRTKLKSQAEREAKRAKARLEKAKKRAYEPKEKAYEPKEKLEIK